MLERTLSPSYPSQVSRNAARVCKRAQHGVSARTRLDYVTAWRSGGVQKTKKKNPLQKRGKWRRERASRATREATAEPPPSSELRGCARAAARNGEVAGRLDEKSNDSNRRGHGDCTMHTLRTRTPRLSPALLGKKEGTKEGSARSRLVLYAFDFFFVFFFFPRCAQDSRARETTQLHRTRPLLLRARARVRQLSFASPGFPARRSLISMRYTSYCTSALY